MKKNPDKITLASVFFNSEKQLELLAKEKPNEKVEIEMTYEDLMIIYKMAKKEFESKRSSKMLGDKG